MPAANTHNIFANNILTIIQDTMSIDIEDSSFLYGAQGPDLFFTHRFMPWMKGENISKYGSMIHQAEPNKVLSIMRTYVARENSVISASYFLGFISHYSLDSTCHPYINFIADEQLEDEPEQTNTIFHCESESALDAIVYRSVYEDLASKVNIGKYFKVNDEVKYRIADLYCHLIKELFDEEVSNEMMFQVIEDAAYVYSWLYDSLGIKKFILNAIEASTQRKLSCHLIPDMENSEFDYANLSKTVWLDKEENERTENFFELIEMAKERTVDIIFNLNARDDNEICDNASFC